MQRTQIAEHQKYKASILSVNKLVKVSVENASDDVFFMLLTQSISLACNYNAMHSYSCTKKELLVWCNKEEDAVELFNDLCEYLCSGKILIEDLLNPWLDK